MALSKTQIDKLGERLKSQQLSDSDLTELDAYRRSFATAYSQALAAARTFTRLEPTGREKSNASIIEKLRRESIRLTQIQDIVGDRMVVEDTLHQNHVALELTGVLHDSRVIDRRTDTSHGYRAVHVIVIIEACAVEIQVRTQLQHRWAQLSEKYSDILDPAIKYGGGPMDVQELLTGLSKDIAAVERVESLQPEARLGVVEPFDLVTPLRRLKEHVHGRLDALVQQLDRFEHRTT